jgi:adenylate cyclase
VSAKVFISYSSADGEAARMICVALENRGIACWLAIRDVGPGENFMEAIVHAIGAAKVMVLVFSENANNSEEVKKELVLASNADVTVVPVRVENVVPKGAFAYQLATRQWIDLFQDWEGQVERLATSIAGILSIQLERKSAAVADDQRGLDEAPQLPERPSIAVLPFQNMSGDPEQEYFADGIAEDIITMLSRSQSLFVIARNSSFTYKGRAVHVKHIARELGVRYVLEGSVRRAGNRVRITAQLIDAITGNHMWGERYDRDPADVFAVQDEITEAIVIAIEPAVAQMEWHRAVRKPPESLGAWEAYQRGRWHMGGISAADNQAAKTFFGRAISLDPNFAAAHAELAIAIFQGTALYQKMSVAEALSELLPATQRALTLDPLCPAGHVSMGLGRFWQGDHEGTLAAARQAIAISPNYAVAHHVFGLALIFSGRPREALGPIRRAIRLDPRDPLRALRLSQIANAHYFLREYAAAIEVAKEALRSYPDHPWAHRWLAAALGQANRLDEAKQALQRAIALAPKQFDMFARQRAPWFRVEDYEHMLEGLRKAGWEA